MTIEMRRVRSSNIKEIGYDPDSEELHVTYLRGGRTIYHGVGPEHLPAALASESVGGYLHRNIKGKHAYRSEGGPVVPAPEDDSGPMPVGDPYVGTHAAGAAPNAID
jgi:hypothetical protein